MLFSIVEREGQGKAKIIDLLFPYDGSRRGSDDRPGQVEVKDAVVIVHLAKSTAHELEIKDRCKNLIARIEKQGGRRQHGSSDFSYDPLSYTLNFEDKASQAYEMPVISFSSDLMPRQSKSLGPTAKTSLLCRQRERSF
ncbi:hypothetical protein SLE2022_117460 [Rubroshorea leprosula]